MSIYYVIEERKTTEGRWETYEVTEHRNKSNAIRDCDLRKTLFGQTPGVRFMFSQTAPIGYPEEFSFDATK